MSKLLVILSLVNACEVQEGKSQCLLYDSRILALILQFQVLAPHACNIIDDR